MAGQDGRRPRARTSRGSATCSTRSASADAKVTHPEPGSGGKSVRVQAKIVEDPIRDDPRRTLADAAGVDAADVLVRPSTATAAASSRSPRRTSQAAQGGGRDGGDAPTGLTRRDGQGRRAARSRCTRPDSCRRARAGQVADALAEVRRRRPRPTSASPRSDPTWGERSAEGAPGARSCSSSLLALYLVDPVRGEDGRGGDRRGDCTTSSSPSASTRCSSFEVTPATVTAFLTILGFSLYDTVVVFDKVAREPDVARRRRAASTYGEMVNRSLNAVLMRSLSTTLVALLPVLSLLVVGSLILGATALEDFALALAAGLFIGVVLVDLRRRAAARVVEGDGAAVPGAQRAARRRTHGRRRRVGRDRQCPVGRRHRRRRGAACHGRAGRRARSARRRPTHADRTAHRARQQRGRKRK